MTFFQPSRRLYCRQNLTNFTCVHPLTSSTCGNLPNCHLWSEWIGFEVDWCRDDWNLVDWDRNRFVDVDMERADKKVEESTRKVVGMVDDEVVNVWWSHTELKDSLKGDMGSDWMVECKNNAAVRQQRQKLKMLKRSRCSSHPLHESSSGLCSTQVLLNSSHHLRLHLHHHLRFLASSSDWNEKLFLASHGSFERLLDPVWFHHNLPISKLSMLPVLFPLLFQVPSLLLFRCRC